MVQYKSLHKLRHKKSIHSWKYQKTRELVYTCDVSLGKMEQGAKTVNGCCLDIDGIFGPYVYFR